MGKIVVKQKNNQIKFFCGAIIIFIFMTGQKYPDDNIFYYAYNEKIFLDKIPEKFVIKFKDEQILNEQSLKLIQTIKDEKIIKHNKTTITIDLKGTGKSIDDIFYENLSGIETIKPAYKFENQELYYSNEIIVQAIDNILIEDVLTSLKIKNKVVVKKYKFYTILELDSTNDACAISNIIQESGLVKFSHPNFIMPIEKHQVLPNDTYFDNQFYLRNTGQVFNPIENNFGIPNADINAPFAWEITTGTNNIVVAVLDEGITSNHPDLPNARQLRLNGSNFVSGQNVNDPSPGQHDNHGNACAGIIAATQNNNEGVSGIAPNVIIMPIKIVGGTTTIEADDLASALDFAWENGADVISNSWGLGSTNPNFVPAIVEAINRATTQGRGNLGCIVTFSASNTASHNVNINGVVRFPSNVQINGVLTVGASDRNDLQSDYSPTSNILSPNNQIIDIVAPSHRAYPIGWGGIAGEGFEVWTIDIPGVNGYNQWNNLDFPGVSPAFGEILPNSGLNNLSYTGRMGGTSASCPQVAGVAALILSQNNSLTQLQVFDIITQSAEKVGGYNYNLNGWCPELGNGRLNACAALNRIPNSFGIVGDESLCTTSSYYVNAPLGSVVTWISSDINIATITSSGVASKVSNVWLHLLQL